jgi:hypothetical protein
MLVAARCASFSSSRRDRVCGVGQDGHHRRRGPRPEIWNGTYPYCSLRILDHHRPLRQPLRVRAGFIRIVRTRGMLTRELQPPARRPAPGWRCRAPALCATPQGALPDPAVLVAVRGLIARRALTAATVRPRQAATAQTLGGDVGGVLTNGSGCEIAP